MRVKSKSNQSIEAGHAPAIGVQPSIPAGLLEVALIDAKACAATGGMGTSWWFEEVKQGRAPAPVIRATRCTRWSLASVREYWAARAAGGGAADAATAEAVRARATRASAAAQAKRRTKRSGE